MRVVSEIKDGVPQFIGSFNHMGIPDRCSLFAVDEESGEVVLAGDALGEGVSNGTAVWFSIANLRRVGVEERVCFAAHDKAALLPGWKPGPDWNPEK